MIYGIILIGILIIFASLLLLLPGSPANRVSLMLSLINIIVVIYGLWILIPNVVDRYKSIASVDDL